MKNVKWVPESNINIVAGTISKREVQLWEVLDSRWAPRPSNIYEMTSQQNNKNKMDRLHYDSAVLE